MGRSGRSDFTGTCFTFFLLERVELWLVITTPSCDLVLDLIDVCSVGVFRGFDLEDLSDFFLFSERDDRDMTCASEGGSCFGWSMESLLSFDLIPVKIDIYF